MQPENCNVTASNKKKLFFLIEKFKISVIQLFVYVQHSYHTLCILFTPDVVYISTEIRIACIPACFSVIKIEMGNLITEGMDRKKNRVSLEFNSTQQATRV